MSEQIPEGWGRARLSELGSMRLGKMLDKGKQVSGIALPYLRNVNVRWGHIDLSDLLTMRFETEEVKEFELRPGDVLICEGGEPGRCAIWQDQESKIKFQKALHRVRLHSEIDPRWLRYHLQHDALLGRLEEYFTGSTIKHFTGVALARYTVWLAPLAEQRRIVAKVEELLPRLNAARERIGKAAALLGFELVPKNNSSLIQAILAKAFRGELVPTEAELARAEGRDYEPASALLERIRADRAARSAPPKGSSRGRKS
jgi:type I restriction enzyme S subunit